MTLLRYIRKPKASFMTSNLEVLRHLRGGAKIRIDKARCLQHSAATAKNAHSYLASSPPKADQHVQNPSLPSFNLFHQLRDARPLVRYTVYVGLGLMATVETTFWFHVLRAKFFPRTSKDHHQQDEELLNRMRIAVKGYRHVWMMNYRRYYGAHMWGLGYGSLDGLEDHVA